MWRGRDSKAKSFSLLLVPGTGSEVLSTEEVRSKHPPISPQPTVEWKAPGLGKEKVGMGVGRGIIIIIWRRRGFHVLDIIKLKGHRLKEEREVKLRNPAFWGHGITSAVLAPDSSPAPQPPPLRWARSDYSLLQYMSFLCSLYHRCNSMIV